MPRVSGTEAETQLQGRDPRVHSKVASGQGLLNRHRLGRTRPPIGAV